MQIGPSGGGLTAGLVQNVSNAGDGADVGTTIAISVLKKATEVENQNAMALIASATGVGTRLDVRG